VPSSKKRTDLRQGAKRDIAVHLAEHGDKDWEVLRAKWGIGYRSWRRWIVQVRNGDPEVDDPEVHKRMREAAQRRVRARKDVEGLRDPPSPAEAVALANPEAVDVLSRVHDLLWRCELLKTHAVITDEDGRVRIRSPRQFEASIRNEINVLRLLIDAQERLWSLTRVKAVFSVMFEEIVKADRETAQRIAAAIQGVHREFGMTMEKW